MDLGSERSWGETDIVCAHEAQACKRHTRWSLIHIEEEFGAALCSPELSEGSCREQPVSCQLLGRLSVSCSGFLGLLSHIHSNTYLLPFYIRHCGFDCINLPILNYMWKHVPYVKMVLNSNVLFFNFWWFYFTLLFSSFKQILFCRAVLGLQHHWVEGIEISQRCLTLLPHTCVIPTINIPPQKAHLLQLLILYRYTLLPQVLHLL